MGLEKQVWLAVLLLGLACGEARAAGGVLSIPNGTAELAFPSSSPLPSGSSPYTIEMWVNPSVEAPNANIMGIFSYGTPTTFQGNAVFFSNNAPGSGGTSGTADLMSAYWGNFAGGQDLSAPSGLTTIAPNTGGVGATGWYHVAISGERKLVGPNLRDVRSYYVNGVQVGNELINTNDSPPPDRNTVNGTLVLGGRIDANSSNFTGYLDEVRIWNDVRTPAEIAALYNKSIGLDTQAFFEADGLLANFTFPTATINDADTTDTFNGGSFVNGAIIDLSTLLANTPVTAFEFPIPPLAPEPGSLVLFAVVMIGGALCIRLFRRRQPASVG